MKLKKMIACILSLCMLATMVPVTALAEDVVAKIGETSYTSLADAVIAANAATEAVTIELQADAELSAGITIKNVNGVAVTIDGNEKTIKPAESATFTGLIVTVRTDLSIINATISGFTTTSDIVNAYKGAELTLTNCVLKNNNGRSIVCTQSGYEDSVIMTGTAFENNVASRGVVYCGDGNGSYKIDKCDFEGNNCTGTAAPVALPGTVSITESSFVNNKTTSTFSSAASAAYCWGEDVTITGNMVKGNTIEATGATAVAALIVKTGDEDIDLSGNTIDDTNVVKTRATVDAEYEETADVAIFVRDNGTGTVKIGSGTIAGTIASANGTGISVTGGTFSDESVKDFVAAGSSVTVGGESYTSVGVAKVGDEYFDDLQEAIKAAAPAGTVEILDDITVEEWVMIAESLTIGTDQLITCVLNGLTINGNGRTLTVNSIESAGNGGYLFYDATKLNINDLTIKYANGLVGGIGLKDGTINNVTFDGGVYGVMPQTGAVTIKDCTFKTNGTAIYFEEERDGLTVTGNTFNQPENANVILIRGDVVFTNNEVVSGRTVNVVSGEPVVTGNDFNDVKLKVYNAAEAKIENNTINKLAFEDDSTGVSSTFTDNTLSTEAQDALAAVGVENVITPEPVDPTPSTTKKSTKKYSVSVDADEIENGSIKLSSSKVKKGATVTLTVTPDAGYELDKLVVLDKDGNEVELTDKGNGKFTFKMPRGGVEVDASFVEIEAAEVNNEKVIVLTIGETLILIDGEYVINDVAPVIRGERTVLPIRVIAEALGATVTWNEADQTVTIVKDDITMVIYIGQAFALVNGEPVQLDQPAFIENGRTYLPLRFIMGNLGADVTWDALTQKVTIVAE